MRTVGGEVCREGLTLESWRSSFQPMFQISMLTWSDFFLMRAQWVGAGSEGGRPRAGVRKL
jgi:hypothetical protein